MDFIEKLFIFLLSGYVNQKIYFYLYLFNVSDEVKIAKGRCV